MRAYGETGAGLDALSPLSDFCSKENRTLFCCHITGGVSVDVDEYLHLPLEESAKISILLPVNTWLESEAGVRHSLNGSCSIGRLPENQIMIEDAKVSRRHALIFPQADVGYWLMDFGSSNGIQLNGRNLLKPTLLQNLDQITIGDGHFLFRQSPAKTTASRESSVPRTTCVAESFAAIQHHSVLLNGEHLAQGKNNGAFELLRHFFSEPFEWPALPRQMLRWIEKQSKLRNLDATESALPEPLVLKKGERRLVIRFEPVLRSQSLLLLTEELSALSLEILQRLGLTERESQIVQWLAQDKSNAEIAKVLALNTRTVEKHVEHILAKLKVSSRMGAMLRIIDLTEKMT